MNQKTSWIFGVNSIKEALLSGRDIKSIFIGKGSSSMKVRELKESSKSKSIPIRWVEKSFFNRFGNVVHQNICAQVKLREFADPDELLFEIGNKSGAPMIIILDRIEDPRNFGAIIRVAECAGANAVFFQSHGSSPFTPLVEKASSGASEYIPMCMVSNIKRTISTLKEMDFVIIGADSNSAGSLWETDLTVPLAIVLGSEGKGLRRTVKEHCDILLKIPLQGRVNSLNVSVAAGIFMFEATRQRR